MPLQFDRRLEAALARQEAGLPILFAGVDVLDLQRYERERALAIAFGLVDDRPLPELPLPAVSDAPPPLPLLPDPGPAARQAMIDAIVAGSAEKLPAIFGAWCLDLAAFAARIEVIRTREGMSTSWGRIVWPTFGAEVDRASEAARQPLVAAARAALEEPR